VTSHDARFTIRTHNVSDYFVDPAKRPALPARAQPNGTRVSTFPSFCAARSSDKRGRLFLSACSKQLIDTHGASDEGKCKNIITRTCGVPSRAVESAARARARAKGRARFSLPFFFLSLSLSLSLFLIIVRAKSISRFHGWVASSCRSGVSQCPGFLRVVSAFPSRASAPRPFNISCRCLAMLLDALSGSSVEYATPPHIGSRVAFGCTFLRIRSSALLPH